MTSLEMFLRDICSVAERITPEELLAITQQMLDTQGGEVAMTIADQLIQKGRQEGLKEGLEKGTLIGEILFVQKMLTLTIYSKEE